MSTLKPIAERWFDMVDIDSELTLLREPHVDPLIRSNTWILRGRDSDLVIDSGLGIAPLPLPIDSRRFIAVATHAHYDHVGGMQPFDEVIVHRCEAEDLRTGADVGALIADRIPREERLMLARAGYPLEGELLDAYPHREFEPGKYALKPVEPTRIVDEGDVIDLGDRRLEVLHLPGHSRGSIGLWDESSGELFSGDAIYDGPLLDELPGSDVDAYVETMRRFRSLPARVVHAGHDPSFGRERLIELCDAYLEGKEG